MEVTAIVTIKQAAAMLQSQNNITILCHRSPDGDTVGSAYALHYGLAQFGQRSRILCSDPLPENMVKLMGEQEQWGEWQEQFVVAVDVADSKLLGSLEEDYSGRVDLVIDHHSSNRLYGKETCLCTTAAATAEIITQLIADMAVKLNQRIATCLYLGLATDTGCFRYSNTTATTMRAGAAMLEAGVESGEINRIFFETKKAGRVALECHVLQNLQYFCSEHCAVMVVSRDVLNRFKMKDSDLEGLSSLPRQIEGVWVGVTVREQEGSCRVSLRSQVEVDASSICAKFGGGGHLRAGGCTIDGTPEEVIAKLMPVIESQISPGGNR